MENDIPNQTTNQLLIHISEAAVFTDPGFAITACNPAASVLLLYNQQNIPRHSTSVLAATLSKTNITRYVVAKTVFSKLLLENGQAILTIIADDTG